MAIYRQLSRCAKVTWTVGSHDVTVTVCEDRNVSKNWWGIFGITQLVGVGLALYAVGFEAGGSAVADGLRLPAIVMLFPGVIAAAAAQLQGFRWLGNFYGAPIIICAITLNAFCWYVISRIIARCHGWLL